MRLGSVLLPASLVCLLLAGCFASHEVVEGSQEAAGAGGTERAAPSGHAGGIGGPGIGVAGVGGSGIGAAEGAGAGGYDGPSSSREGTEGRAGAGGAVSRGGTGGDAKAPLDPVTDGDACFTADMLLHDFDRLSCEWIRPRVPDGEIVDRDLINFEYTDPEGERHVMPRVSSATQCRDLIAWFYPYQGDPIAIGFCPAACRGIVSQEYADIRMVTSCYRLPI
jgi:hypothetical protein